jgi:hypothetical protein
MCVGVWRLPLHVHVNLTVPHFRVEKTMLIWNYKKKHTTVIMLLKAKRLQVRLR